MTTTKLVICPYCGETQPAHERCRVCGGLFEPLSRQATHNAMGPWFIHNRERPHQPGCSYETLAALIERGQVTKYSIIRGPTSKQFWTIAKHVPGVAHLLGYCHACDAEVSLDDHGCPQCGAPFGAYLDRNALGLPDIRPLPWEAPQVEDADEAGEGTRTLSWSAAASDAKRVSSFAPDENLLESASVRPDILSDGLTGASAGPPPPPDTPPDRSVNGGDLLRSPAVRSMQRRIAGQQRTIRVLTVLVILVAAAGAGLNLLVATSLRGEVGDRAAEESSRPPGQALPIDLMDEKPAAPAAGEADGEDSGGTKTAGDMSGPAPAPAPVPATDSDEGEELRHALSLVERAENTDRSRPSRVRDYEDAILLLQHLAANAAASDRPDLESRIVHLEDAAERLRLEQFFRPESSPEK